MKAIFKTGSRVAKEANLSQVEIPFLEVTDKENFTVSVRIKIFRNIYLGQLFEI